MDFDGRSEGGFVPENQDELSNELMQGQSAAAPLGGLGRERIVQAGPDNVIVLPAGADLEGFAVDGRDLIITLEDGSVIRIPDGAIVVPQFVIDGVSIAPQTVAALLTGNEPEPEAGNPQSSGGNFAGDVGDIQAAYAIGDLLPYTELFRPQYPEKEIIPFAPNDPPEIIVITPDNPAGAVNASDEVNESGLPAREGESAGTNSSSNSEITNGTIVYTTPDGFASLSINGVAITAVGQVIQGEYGTLLITSIGGGQVGYTYTLTDNLLDVEVDSFAITVTDADGDMATATLDIRVIDDAPIANNDSASQTEEGATVTVDVFDNDVPGADSVAIGTVQYVQGSLSGTGTLVNNGDGTFTYTPGPGEQGTVTFQYSITDGDNDSDTATVTITLLPDSIPTGGTVTATVDDDALAGGNPNSTTGDLDANAGDNPADTSEATFTGTLAFSAGNDAPATITFDPALNGATATVGTEQVTYSLAGNVLTATGPRGVLFTVELTDPATGAYRVTLVDNVLHAGGPNDEATDATLSVGFVVTDSDGDSVATTLSIVFDDDAPTAFANSNSVTEGDSVSGNVLTDGTADIAGADGFGGVVAVTSSNNESETTSVVEGSLVIEGQYGTLTVDAATGAYTYVSNANSTNADAVDSFTYTIVDGDGDTATATLTINIGNVAGVVTDSDALVNEAGLPAGSDAASNSEIANGQITVTGATGTLTYVLTSPADGTYGTLVLNSATGEYTYTLDTPYTDGDTAENTTNTVSGAEGFGYEVYDSLGNFIGSGTISVSIIDDVPTAADEAPLSIAEDAAGTLSGNVLGNDVQGADGATVTSVNIGGTDHAIAATGTTSVSTANGDYTFDAAGNWTFDPATGLDQSAGDVDASFTYTLTDGDDDFDTATQPITISDGAGPQAGEPVSLQVDDQNLADGSDPAAPVTDSGDIVFTAGSDAIASIIFDDSATALDSLGGGLTWERVSDTQIVGRDGADVIVTLDLSVSGTTATVTLTLSDNYALHPDLGDDLAALGSVLVVATDIDGDQASASVSLSVSDDLPTLSTSAPEAGSLEVDETSLGTDATADFSGLFTPDYNADGPGSVSGYTLGVAAGSTGLVDTLSGEAVVLTLESGAVVGRTETGGDIVFILSVDAAGTVTLDQQRAVVHADGTNPDDATGLASGDLITLSATVTDGDGDTASATVSIGDAISFRDDGPSIDASLTDGNEILLTTQDAETIGAAFDTASTTADFSGSFTIDSSSYGADGAGSIGWNYGFVIENANSGLFSNGVEITLAFDGADIVGSAGGTEVFRLSVDADTGVVTLTQYEEIDHALPGDGAAPYDTQFAVLGDGILTLQGTATIIDADGDEASETLDLDLGGNIRFADDGPTANPDTDSTTEGVEATGNVLTGADTDSGAAGADVGGADGFGSPTVVGVAAGSDTGTPATGGVGTQVAGTYGTLTLNADGSYSYLVEANAISSDAVETFVYTIVDADGDTSTTTLTFNVANVGLTADNDTQVVDEAALSFGSNPSLTTETVTGQLAVAGTGVTYALNSGSNTYGTLTLNPDGSYSYTLTAPYDTSPDADNGTNTELGAESYSYTATDANGNTVTGTITINIVDDVPTAVADTNSVTEGADVSGNVLTDAADEFGADGPEAAGGVVGVRAAGGDTTSDATGNVGATINGLYGTLTLNADGSYTYVSTANAVTGDVQDVFVYTIEDGDGDLSTTTLTIDVDNVTLVADNDTQVVDEAALSFGSNPSLTTETVTGQLAVAGTGVTYALNSGSNTYGTLTLNPDGSYSYTLTAPYDTSPDADNGTNTELGAESYSYTATDANGNTVTGTITINIVDDVPTAVADTNSVTEGADVSGNVLTDAADEFGADGPEAAGGVVGVRAAGGDTTSDASGNVGATINGLYGTLTLNADGSYTYVSTANAVTGDVQDVFVYTIEDGDGDLSTTTLTIDVDNVTLVADNDTQVVDEAALSFGSNPSLTTETVTGQLAVAGTGVTYALNSGSDTYGTLTLNPDGSYSYTLTAPYDTSPDADNGTNTELGAESYSYTATDANGNTVTGTITINIVDDVPTANADVNSLTEDTTSVGGNVLTDNADEFGADGEGSPAVSAVTGFGGATGTVGGVTVGEFGSLQLNGNGTYTYTLDTAAVQYLGAGENETDSFTYTIVDADGDTSTTTLIITITGTNDAPVVTGSAAAVSEEGIVASGNPDNVGDPVDTTNSISDSGTITITDVDDSSFTVTLGIPTTTGLTSGGLPITWSLSPDGQALVGSTTAGTVILVSIDDTGAWTVDLVAPIDHPDATSEDVYTFDIPVNVSDGTTTTTVNSGITVSVEDDSPIASTGNSSGSVDEDALSPNGLEGGPGDIDGGAGTITATATGSVTSLFSSGADLTPTYGFDTNDAQDALNALGLTSHGVALSYVVSSGSIVATAGGSPVFTMALQSNGDWTFTLEGPLDHDTANTEDNLTIDFGFLVQAIDADGDTVDASGSVTITINDDTPVAQPDTNALGEDTSSVGGNVLTDGVDDAFGADGAGAPALTGVTGFGGAAGTIGGSTTGEFGSLQLNANGTYTYTLNTAAVQYLGAGESETDTFTYTIVDADGDHSTTTLTITINGSNDAPVVTGSVARVSEEGLNGGIPDSVGTPSDTTNSFEASGQITITDADDATFTVTLGLPTTPGLTSGGLPVTWQLSVDGQALQGSTSAGTVMFVAIDNAGNWTVDLVRPLDHSTTGVEDILGFNVPVNVNDGTTTTTISNGILVVVEDDSPVAVSPVALVGTNAASGGGIAYLDSDNDVDNNFGGDGGRVIFTQASIDALVAQNLTSGFESLVYQIGNNGTELVARTSGSNELVFTIVLDPNSAQDQYIVTMAQPLDSTSTIDFNGGNYNFVGGNLSWTGFVPTGETLGGTPVNNDSFDLLLTPEIGGAPGSSVNTTATIGGIGNTFVGSQSGGETFRIDFVTDLRGDPADTTQNNYAGAANRDHVFDGHYTVNGATALFKSSTGSTVRITAFDDADGNNVVGDGVIDHINGVTIAYLGVSYGSVIIPTSTPTNYTVNGHVFTVTLNVDGSVSVAGVAGESGSSLNGTVIGVLTDDGYNSVEYSWQAGSTFQIGDFGATTITNDPVNFTVPVSVIDNDGDTSPSGTLDITLNPASTTTTLAEAFFASAKSVPVSEPLLASNTDPLTSNNGFQSELRSMGMMSLAAAASGFAMNHQVSDFGGFELRATMSDMGFDMPAFHASSLAALPDVDLGFEMGVSHFAASNFSIPAATVPMSGFDGFEAAQMSGLIDMAQGHVSGFANNGFAMTEPAIDSGFASAVPMSDAMGGMEALLMLAAAPAAQQAVELAGDPAAALADLGAQSALDAAIDYFATGEPFGTAGLGGEAGGNAMLAGMLDVQIDSLHAVGMGTDLVQDAALVLETASHA